MEREDYDDEFDVDSDNEALESEEDAPVDEDDAVGDTYIERRRGNYTILSPAEIQERQEQVILLISGVLSVSKGASCVLLHRYGWDPSRVQDEWFSDEPAARKAAGLLETPVFVYSHKSIITCPICFDDHRPHNMLSASCGHPYCPQCWKGYITASIADGPGCLSLKCPDPSCSAAVDSELIDKLASKEERTKYARYLLRSYIEDGRGTKWCPSPGCEFAIAFVAGSESYDVSCDCSHSFCWNCLEEVHRPVDCNTVAKWLAKNSCEAENTQWIMAYTKPCPNCKRPIEKNHGCMHMTCRAPCYFQFCWLCLAPYIGHGGSCNRFTEKKDETTRRLAKLSIERYTHYYERWAGNHNSRQKALGDLKELQDGNLEKLRSIYSLPQSQVKFLTEAWLQIAECRRVLQWTYAYGYYLLDQEKAKREYFEFVQGEAESGLERLHHCAELELQVHLDPGASEEGFVLSPKKKEGFEQWRTKLIGLTKVTETYFENLVKALETGLQDIGVPHAIKGSKRKVFDLSGSSELSEFMGEGFEEFWSCRVCTFVNPKSARTCQVCELWPCDRCTYLNPSSRNTCMICSGQGDDQGVN